MAGRVTLEGLRAKRLPGESVAINLVLSRRLSKVVGRVELTGVEPGVVTVANKNGTVRYWSGFVDGLIEVAKCMPVTAGAYAVTITGGALLTEGEEKTTAEQIDEIEAAMISNAVAKAAAEAQVALLADVPSMIECLEGERAALAERLTILMAE